jgi:hypothetical protein
LKEISEDARKPGRSAAGSGSPAEKGAFEAAVGRNRQVVNHCAFSKAWTVSLEQTSGQTERLS